MRAKITLSKEESHLLRREQPAIEEKKKTKMPLNDAC